MVNRFLERLGSGASVPALKKLWRAASRRAHPDSGGEASTFVALRREYEEALAFLEAGIESASRPPDRSAPAPSADHRAAGPDSRPGPVSPELKAFRDAITALGDAAREAGCDPYRWKPPRALALALVEAARGFDPSAALALSRLLAALAESGAEWRRYPGLMNRAFAFYKACAALAAWNRRGWKSDEDASRTRLADLAEPSVALFDSTRFSELPARFAAAASALERALPPDPRV